LLKKDKLSSAIGKCSRYKEYLTQEEFPSHKCKIVNRIPINGVKEIIIEYFYEIQDNDGNTLFMAKGLDGTLYRLLRRERKFIPIIASDEFSQRNPSDKDFTEPTSVLEVLRNALGWLLHPQFH
jgi:hypothetical protein